MEDEIFIIVMLGLIAIGLTIDIGISYAIAKAKGQMPLGLWLGLLLGPLGWLITALLPTITPPAPQPSRMRAGFRPCPACGKGIRTASLKARGNVCPWCGVEFDVEF